MTSLGQAKGFKSTNVIVSAIIFGYSNSHSNHHDALDSWLLSQGCSNFELEPGSSGAHIQLHGHIFNYLDVVDKKRAAQVCKAWRATLYLPSLWRDAVADLPLGNVDLEVFHILLSRDIRWVRAYDVTALATALELMPDLRGIEYKNSHYNPEDVAELLRIFDRIFPHLISLKLKLPFRADHSEFIRLVADNSPELVTLELNSCHKLSSAAINSISRLQKLKSLRMDDLWVDISHLTQSLIRLESFHCERSSTITDNTLIDMSSGWPNLKCIALTYCIRVTDGAFAHLSKLGNLESITINHNDFIGTNGIPIILGGMARLRYLDVEGTNTGDDSLANLVAGGSKITRLNLAFCRNVTDAGLKHLSRMTNLTTVDLGDCPNITENGIDGLLKKGISVIEFEKFPIEYKYERPVFPWS